MSARVYLAWPRARKHSQRSAAEERAHHATQGVRQPRDAYDVRDWVQVIAAELARLPAVERKVRTRP